MEKIGFLLFVIVLFFGCQKSQDVEFEKEIDRIKQWYGIEILLQKGRTNFDVFETFQGIEGTNHIPLWKLIIFHENENLNRENLNLKESLERFAQHKYKYRVAHHGAIDSTKVYSIIQVLKSKTENLELSDEKQFSEIINTLEDLPSYFSQAKAIIKNPTQKKLEYAISAYSQDYFYLKDQLPLLLRKPDILKEDQINFSQKNEEAQLAVKDFIAFLNSQLFELGE